jgi:hypothetical protein
MLLGDDNGDNGNYWEKGKENRQSMQFAVSDLVVTVDSPS